MNRKLTPASESGCLKDGAYPSGAIASRSGVEACEPSRALR
jgi:hypothetical protein